MVEKTQTSKDPQKENSDETGKDGNLKAPVVKVEMSPEEEKQFGEFKEVVKETGFTKFSESAKEALRLLNETKTLKQQLEESNATLSDEELMKINPDYPVMTEDEQKKFKDDVKIKRRLMALEAKEKMRQDYNNLPEAIKKKIEEKGGYDKFVDFACSPENAGQKNLLNVAKSYVFEEESTPTPPENPERPGLEEPSGGQEVPPIKQEGEMTAEEARELRTRNPKEYERLAREKKLKIVG